ncbi:class C beta-lactamase-related serine hydrolase [Halioglobus maricola]|uniref:Class C beta-lactamase-related serine hydrolase n=1 Tax=Halioglobus maricola TaxID=2601894 RepID=A0A5P9NL58_9GAMM|nr:serine hydrolase [Halioglobus maricola]QFU76603.1 class C beta-lactamase-related serine hydrolase [Halioglobus maricola]
MIKKVVLATVLATVAFLAWDFYSAPVFWKRMAATFSASGKGAYSEVFDNREVVRGAPEERDLPVAPSGLASISGDALADMVEYAAYFDSFSLLVLHRGQVQLEWYRDDYSAASLTQSQSMHKSIQALLIGQALAEGLIASIDDPVGKYLSEWRDDPRGDITINELLQMSSGLESFSGGFNPWGDAFRWLYADDTRAATLAFGQSGAAGEQFDYNDLNAQLLGLVLSEATGERYADYLSRVLWQPLGNSDAQVWLDRPGGEAMHACCLLATTRDWARLGQLLLQEGQWDGEAVLDAQWIQRAATPSPHTPHYGFQIWLASNVQANPRKTGYQRKADWLDPATFYFSGYGAQRVYVSPNYDLVIVRTGPAAGYFPKIIEEWDNSFLVNRAIQGLQQESP